MSFSGISASSVYAQAPGDGDHGERGDADHHPPEVDEPSHLLASTVVVVLDLRELGPRAAGALRDLGAFRPAMLLVDDAQEVARDGDQPLHGDPLAGPVEHLAHPDRQGLGRMHRVSEVRRVAGCPVGGAVEANLRGSPPEEAQDAATRLFRDGDGRGFARAPVRVDDRAVLLREVLELRSVLLLGRPVQLTLLVKLPLAQEVSPDELGERHRFGRSDSLTRPRFAQCPSCCRRSRA